ncbi:hypothetical protein [Neoaquamicrobium sediminum]|uniref:hypothetical protein n=1 Tax=Neoaquamicrobium sediminum TaxID=1849104 RepID=UPI0035E44991
MNKASPEKDIDKPLGVGSGRRGAGRKTHRRLRAGQVVLALAGLCLFGTAGFIALGDDPFRTPQQVVVSTPEQTPEAGTATASETAAAYPDRSAADGPSIIKVEPSDTDESSNVVIIRDPSSLGQNPRTAHLPDRALIEDTDIGPLPIRAADGRRAFDVYARPWSGTRGARVAIVIGGSASPRPAHRRRSPSCRRR